MSMACNDDCRQCNTAFMPTDSRARRRPSDAAPGRRLFALAGSVLVLSAPRAGYAVVRADPPPVEPRPGARAMSTALGATGGREPVLRGEDGPLILRQAGSHVLGREAAAPSSAGAPPASVPSSPPTLYAAGNLASDAAHDDGDEVGSDEPIGPPVLLGDMPGRRPPPYPTGAAARTSSTPVGTAACPPGQPCVMPAGTLPCQPGQACTPGLVGTLPGTLPDGGAPSIFGDGSGVRAALKSTGDEGSGGGWGLAPIRWGGSVGVQMLRQQTQDNKSNWSNYTGIFNLRGASYIYAPWMAQVAANLSFTGTRGTSSGEGTGSFSNDQTSIVGGAMLNLFPQSRFPFLATIDRTDSQVNGSFVTSPYTNTRINLRQSYRSESGQQNGNIGFDRSVVEQRSAVGTDTVNAVYGDYSHAFENQTTQINGRYAQTDRDYNGESSRLMNYYARHTYRYEENLNLETNTMFNDNRLRYLVNNSLVNSSGRYLQMNSSASWRPEDEEIPLAVTAGVMVLDASSNYQGESSKSQSVSGNMSATYAYSDNLMLMGSGLVSKLNNKGSSGGQDVLTNFGLAANYAGTPLTFGNYSYNWNAGSSVNRQSGGSFGSNTMTMLQANHSLGREIPLGDRQSVQLSASQGVTQSNDQIIGNSTTLNHSAGSTWRFTAGDQTFGSVGVTFSDNRTTGANEGDYQYIYLQLNGNGQLTPRSSFSVNMTVQWSMQDTQTLVVNNSPFLGTTAYYTDRTSRTSIFGSANYSHSRAFDVPGLRYNLSLNANTQMGDERLYGNANGNPERYTWWLENRFDYAIGKLDLSTTGTLTEVGGKKNAQIFFRATRNFGKF